MLTVENTHWQVINLNVDQFKLEVLSLELEA